MVEELSLYHNDVQQLKVSKSSYPTEWTKDEERSIIFGQGSGGGLEEFGWVVVGGGVSRENLERERVYLQSSWQRHSVTVPRKQSGLEVGSAI